MAGTQTATFSDLPQADISFTEWVARFSLAIMSGSLLTLALPNGNLSLLAWVAFVPLLLVLDGQYIFRVAMFAWIGALTFFFFTLDWLMIPLRDYAHWTALASLKPTLLICAIEALFSCRCVRRRMFRQPPRETSIDRYLAGLLGRL